MTDTYAELNRELDEAIARTALFKPAAFHVHSPGSYDWGQRDHAVGTLNNRVQYEAEGGEGAFLDHLAAQYDIVCVTDHMKSAYARRLAEAAVARDDITVFPGMEVNCKLTDTGPERLHLLVIFPPEAADGHIERIFAGQKDFPVDADRTGREDYLPSGTLAQWCKEVKRQGALIIIAHVDDGSRGHRARFRSLRESALGTFVGEDGAQEIQREVAEEYKRHILACSPNALEIMNPEDRCHYVGIDRGDGSTVDIPCVVRSDFHCIEDFSDPDRRTYIKVASTDFKSVREALRFSRTRLRFSSDLPEMPAARLIGLRIRSAGNGGLFSDTLLPFNPNLNCLIGPRGCGKSTVIEALRYVCGLNGLLPDDGPQHGGRSFEDVARGIQSANLTDTKIEVVYQTSDGERLALSATYDPKEDFTTVAFTLEGDPIDLSVEGLHHRCPVRIYSWSEIETLGREHELQRDLIDRLVPGLNGHKQRRTEIRNDLGTSSMSLLNLARQLDEKFTAEGGLLRRYTELKQDFERLNTPELAERFERLDLARRQVTVLADTAEKLQQLTLKLEDLLVPTQEQLWERDTGAPDDDLESWWQDEVITALHLSELTGDLESAKASISASLARREQTVARLREEANGHVATEEAAIREGIGAETEQSIQVDQRERSKARFERAERLRNEYLALHRDFTGLLQQRADLIEELKTAQLAVTGTRSNYRTTLTEKLAEFEQLDIAIDLRGSEDRRKFIEFMRDGDFLTRDAFGNYKQQRVAERCARMATPVVLADAILTKEIARLTAAGINFGPDALAEREGWAFVNAFHPLDHDDSADVPTVNRDRLQHVLELQEQPWEDAVTILLDRRPVDMLSPGQRSSAMLPLIALAEDVPLIIDQPEDNLDNRLVGQTLTQILAQLKEHRQIIVATHSPNIVVGGDAEQVIVLESPAARTAVVHHWGSIDDEEIVQSVIGIMEGGREAFQLRGRRYGFDTSV